MKAVPLHLDHHASGAAARAESEYGEVARSEPVDPEQVSQLVVGVTRTLARAVGDDDQAAVAVVNVIGGKRPSGRQQHDDPQQHGNRAYHWRPT